MVADSLRYFNWVDILVIMIALKIIYTALNKGMVIEFFKLCGTIFTIYVSLHYYTNVSDWMRLHAGLKRMPLEFLDFFICLSLAALSYIVFVFIRVVFARLVKMETTPRLSKLGGLLLGTGRLILLNSLIVFMLTISGISYLKRSAKYSYFGKDLFQVTVNTYTWLWNNITSKFMPDEELNKTVLEVQRGFLRR